VALDQGLIAANPIRQMKKLREERKLPISDERISILEEAIHQEGRGRMSGHRTQTGKTVM